MEIREYWQTTDIAWLHTKKAWAGLASIVMTQNTIIKDDVAAAETRYFISSLPLNVEEGACRSLPLDGGKLSLALGRDLPGRRQPYA